MINKQLKTNELKLITYPKFAKKAESLSKTAQDMLISLRKGNEVDEIEYTTWRSNVMFYLSNDVNAYSIEREFMEVVDRAISEKSLLSGARLLSYVQAYFEYNTPEV